MAHGQYTRKALAELLSFNDAIAPVVAAEQVWDYSQLDSNNKPKKQETINTEVVSKLGGIAAGAEVNQNAFSKISGISHGTFLNDVDATTKTDQFTFIAGDNITLENTTGKGIKISASGGGGSTTPGNGQITIQKNGASVGSFTVNQTANKTINLIVPVIGETEGTAFDGARGKALEDVISDKNYIANIDSGMGKIVLKRNQSLQSQVTQTNTIYVIQDDLHINGGSVILNSGNTMMVGGVTYSYSEIYLAGGETIQLTNSSNKIFVQNSGYQWVDEGTTYTAASDVTARVGALAYSANKIDYTYTGVSSLTVPANCVLEFDGGSLNSGTVEGASGVTSVFVKGIVEGNAVYNLQLMYVKEIPDLSAALRYSVLDGGMASKSVAINDLVTTVYKIDRCAEIKNIVLSNTLPGEVTESVTVTSSNYMDITVTNYNNETTTTRYYYGTASVQGGKEIRLTTGRIFTNEGGTWVNQGGAYTTTGTTTVRIGKDFASAGDVTNLSYTLLDSKLGIGLSTRGISSPSTCKFNYLEINNFNKGIDIYGNGYHTFSGVRCSFCEKGMTFDSSYWTGANTIENSRFNYCETGIEFSSTPLVASTYIHNCIFEANLNDLVLSGEVHIRSCYFGDHDKYYNQAVYRRDDRAGYHMITVNPGARIFIDDCDLNFGVPDHTDAPGCFNSMQESIMFNLLGTDANPCEVYITGGFVNMGNQGASNNMYLVKSASSKNVLKFSETKIVYSNPSVNFRNSWNICTPYSTGTPTMRETQNSGYNYIIDGYFESAVENERRADTFSATTLNNDRYNLYGGRTFTYGQRPENGVPSFCVEYSIPNGLVGVEMQLEVAVMDIHNASMPCIYLTGSDCSEEGDATLRRYNANWKLETLNGSPYLNYKPTVNKFAFTPNKTNGIIWFYCYNRDASDPAYVEIGYVRLLEKYQSNMIDFFPSVKPASIVGPTTDRPGYAYKAMSYFDTTLDKPIWHNGSKWVENDGCDAGVVRTGVVANRPAIASIKDGFVFTATTQWTPDIQLYAYAQSDFENDGWYPHAADSTIDHPYWLQVADYAYGGCCIDISAYRGKRIRIVPNEHYPIRTYVGLYTEMPVVNASWTKVGELDSTTTEMVIPQTATCLYVDVAYSGTTEGDINRAPEAILILDNGTGVTRDPGPICYIEDAPTTHVPSWVTVDGGIFADAALPVRN